MMDGYPLMWQGIGLQGGLQYEIRILRIIGYLRMILVLLSKNG
jgi:hypothetical protein